MEMEAILGPNLEPFETFLSDHSSMSEEKRMEAKSMFNMIKCKDPESLAIKLVHYLGCNISHDNSLPFRQKCAELLNKLLIDDDDLCTWHNLISISTQFNIKCVLLDCFFLPEESTFVIYELRNIILKLAASLLPGENWPELLPSLCKCITNYSSSEYLKESAFFIIGQLAKDIGETLVPCIKDLHLLFRKTLNDATILLDVRIATTRDVISFIQCVPTSSKEKERFQDLLPGIMNTLSDALMSNDREENAARKVLRFLVDLARNEPRFLRRQLVSVVGSVLDIAEDENLDEGTRQWALEFLLTLVEAKEKTPGMMKRVPLFIGSYFAILLKLLLDIKDDPKWHSFEILHDDEWATSNYQAGVINLIRFSNALGGKTIAPIAKEQLSPYLVASQWEKRHAALIALSHIARACSKMVIIKNMEQLVIMVRNCLQYRHPRVKWAACYAIAQLSTAFRPEFQEQYHQQVVPALAATLDDFQSPRVQAQAAGALANFCGPNMLKTLSPYLDVIVNKLLLLLQNGKLIVQQDALGAMSGLAQYVEEHFRTYYDTVMPHLKAMLINTDLKYEHILRAKAVECISFVGFAGGTEKFREDAKQVMEMLISSGLEVEGEDPRAKYLLVACTRICSCLGQDFLPYMSSVMPFLIQCAHLDNAIAVFQRSDSVTACFMLCIFINTLKEEFYPWIPQVVSVFLPLVKFYAEKNIRGQSAQAMALLLHSAKLAVEKGIAQGAIGESYFAKLSSDIILSLTEALHEEPMAEVCAVMLDVLNDCLQICQPLLNEGQLRRIVDEVKHVITESSNRKRKLKERKKSEDFDAEEDELLKEEREQEDNILLNVCQILVTLIDTFKGAFLPFFEELSSYLIPMWAEDKTTQERCTSSCIFVYLLKQFPEESVKYADVFLPLFVDGSNDENPAVRQNALYGLMIYAEYGGSVFKPFVRDAVSRINIVITHIRAREPENEQACNNAVFALAKICQLHRESIDSSQVVPIWLSCLPIKGTLDTLDEAKYINDQLCSMVERLDKELVGPNYKYLAKIISVFIEVLCSEDLLGMEETTNRMINILRHLHQTLSPTAFKSTWSYLLPRQEMKLKSFLSLEKDANL